MFRNVIRILFCFQNPSHFRALLYSTVKRCCSLFYGTNYVKKNTDAIWLNSFMTFLCKVKFTAVDRDAVVGVLSLVFAGLRAIPAAVMVIV